MELTNLEFSFYSVLNTCCELYLGFNREVLHPAQKLECENVIDTLTLIMQHEPQCFDKFVAFYKLIDIPENKVKAQEVLAVKHLIEKFMTSHSQ